jgi:hypothetical protein
MITQSTLHDVHCRISDLAINVNEKAIHLANSGGIDSCLNEEEAAAVLFTAALLDVADEIKRQVRVSGKMRRALVNLRHF